MEIVERILANVVGAEISVEEMELISGAGSICPRDNYVTYGEGGGYNCDEH